MSFRRKFPPETPPPILSKVHGRKKERSLGRPRVHTLRVSGFPETSYRIPRTLRETAARPVLPFSMTVQPRTLGCNPRPPTPDSRISSRSHRLIARVSIPMEFFVSISLDGFFGEPVFLLFLPSFSFSPPSPPKIGVLLRARGSCLFSGFRENPSPGELILRSAFPRVAEAALISVPSTLLFAVPLHLLHRGRFWLRSGFRWFLITLYSLEFG